MNLKLKYSDGENRLLLPRCETSQDQAFDLQLQISECSQDKTLTPRSKRRSSDFGSQQANALLNFDPDTPRLSQRVSLSGCIVDIGELTSLLSQNSDTDKRRSSGITTLAESIDECASYWMLFRYNLPFTLYTLSYLCAHAGEWFTYVAQLTAVHQLCHGSKIAISALVVIRMAPNILFASIGGVVADLMDRRLSMIMLDIAGIFVVLLYLPVLRYKSVTLIYAVSFIQAILAAIYNPIRLQMIPLLVPKGRYLIKATTISGLSWSLMASLGASIGGFVISKWGVEIGFLLGIVNCLCLTSLLIISHIEIDSLTYLLSAVLMWLVGGEWSGAEEEQSNDQNTSLSIGKAWSTFKSMTIEGISYLWNSSFGVFVLIKASGALSLGSADVLNVSLSHIQEDDDGDEKRLGILFAMTGIGCLLGPIATEKIADLRNTGAMICASFIGIAFMTISFALISSVDSIKMNFPHFPILRLLCADSGGSFKFAFVCVCTFLRGVGSSIMWVNSTLLLQKLSADEKLGRVLSVDFSLCMLSLTVSTLLTGFLEDNVHMDSGQTSLVMTVLGIVPLLAWSAYFAREMSQKSNHKKTLASLAHDEIFFDRIPEEDYEF